MLPGTRDSLGIRTSTSHTKHRGSVNGYVFGDGYMYDERPAGERELLVIETS